MGSFVSIVLYLVAIAIVLTALFFVIRAAVLSALRTHHSETRSHRSGER